MNYYKEIIMEKDLAEFTVDFKSINNYEDVHTCMMKNMHFPYYYGYNLDALWDCLTDLICYDHVTIYFLNFQNVEAKFPEEAAVISEELKMLKHVYTDAYYDMFEIFIERNGITEEIL